MDKNEILSLYSSLGEEDKNVIDGILHKEKINKLINNKLNKLTSQNTELKYYDKDQLLDILLTSGESIDNIISYLEHDVNYTIGTPLIGSTRSEKISKKLFHFIPKVGKNPMGNGEFLASFYFNNIKKHSDKGDLIINGIDYELKSSINNTSGGGKLRVDDNSMYNVPYTVAKYVLRILGNGLTVDELSINRKRMSSLSKLTELEVGRLGTELFRGLYPKITNLDLEIIVTAYKNAVFNPSKFEIFSKELLKFQLRYIQTQPKHKNFKILLVNKKGSLVELTEDLIEKEYGNLIKVKHSMSFTNQSGNNNVLQISVANKGEQ